MNAEPNHAISQVGGNTTAEPVSKTTSQNPVPITGYNMRCPAVKRLMREAAELANPEDDYAAHPTETNLFEWHFTIRGPEGTDFENGVYHGRIIFPSEYPMKPPSFILLTPNGRFQTEEKICLSISNYHPETWLPSWSIRTALVALRSFMETPGNEGAIGSLNFAPEERRKLAIKSKTFECLECGPILKLLPAQKEGETGIKSINANSNSQTGQGQQENAGPGPSQQSSTSTNSAFQKEIPGTENGAGGGDNANNGNAVVQTKEETNKNATNNAANDNQEGAAGYVIQQQARHQHQQQHQQQPHEPIKNILYDFGIGCFVILILALCLRRLMGIFLTVRL